MLAPVLLHVEASLFLRKQPNFSDVGACGYQPPPPSGCGDDEASGSGSDGSGEDSEGGSADTAVIVSEGAGGSTGPGVGAVSGTPGRSSRAAIVPLGSDENELATGVTKQKAIAAEAKGKETNDMKIAHSLHLLSEEMNRTSEDARQQCQRC